MPSPLDDALLRDLRDVVGADGLRVRPAELLALTSDGLPTHHAVPRLAVLPRTREEVIGVIQVLHRHQTPFVARGAGTGLSGGALADRDAVLVILTRLDRILHIDAAARRATVEPGVVNATLSEAIRHLGLQYAPDPSSQSACTIGGNVAENAGGPHCLKYGVTTNHVVALDLLRPDGTVVRLGSPSGEPWGPDLVGLFVGSEGMFGIALAVTVRLIPLPSEVRTFLAGFPSVRAASEAVREIIATGIVPAALEMLDQASVRAVEASIYAAGYPTDAAAVLLVELDGRPEAVAAESDRVAALLRRGGATTLRTASSAAERARLWQGRKKVFGAMGRIARDMVVQDAVVPRSALPDILDRVEAVGRSHGLTIVNVFHAGDGNLHPNICYDHREPGAREKVLAASREIMTACLAAGGTITGEHGVGLDKADQMPQLYSEPSLRQMCAVKHVFDPQGRSNPGKVIPVRYCREWGKGAETL